MSTILPLLKVRLYYPDVAVGKACSRAMQELYRKVCLIQDVGIDGGHNMNLTPLLSFNLNFFPLLLGIQQYCS